MVIVCDSRTGRDVLTRMWRGSATEASAAALLSSASSTLPKGKEVGEWHGRVRALTAVRHGCGAGYDRRWEGERLMHLLSATCILTSAAATLSAASCLTLSTWEVAQHTSGADYLSTQREAHWSQHGSA